MIDLRMVADDRGNLQLQMRSRKVNFGGYGSLGYGGVWTPWQSVPIVHDTTQLVDRVEIIDARSSGAKPDIGLTVKQLAELLTKLKKDRRKYKRLMKETQIEEDRISHSTMAIAYSQVLEDIEEILGQQADESIDDEFDPDLPY